MTKRKSVTHEFPWPGRWGHSLVIERSTTKIKSKGKIAGKKRKQEVPIYRGYCFSPRTINNGDFLAVPMKSGKMCLFKVIDVEWLLDPGDMYLIKAYPHHYVGDDNA